MMSGKMLMRQDNYHASCENKPLADIVGLRALPSKVATANHFFCCALPSKASSDENLFGCA